jgi:hypothetical protein
MSTEVKVGFARQQYGRDRYDHKVSMDDLPLILAEHEIDPTLIERMAYTTRLEILRLTAEVHTKTVYLKHEAADAGWQKGAKPTPGMLGAKADLDARKAELKAVLAPYVPAPEPAGT